MTDTLPPSLQIEPSDPAVDPAADPAADVPAASPGLAPVAAEAAAPFPAPRRRARRVGLFLLSFVLGLAAVIGVASAGLAAWDASYEAKVLPGVHVGSIDLSGLDRAGATAALTSGLAFDGGKLVLRTPSSDLAIPFAAIGRRADVAPLVDAALAAGRSGDLAARVAGQLGQALHGTELRANVVVDRDALVAAVTTALAAVAKPPVDATISMQDGGFLMTPARDGTSVDPTPVVEAALAAVMDPSAPAEVVIPVTTTAVAPAVSDAAVRDAAARANLILAKNLTVAYGKKSWTIKSATIRTWLGFGAGVDGTIQPTIDTAKIPKALAKAIKAVATPAKSAVFLRAKSGRIVGVAASADGKKLDTTATSQLIADTLLARVANPAAKTVKVATAPVPPKLTTEQAKLKAPVLTLLGTWTTWFPINDHNYFGANIWIPARIINGTVLAPGQTFDWWNTVGDVTPGRGFGPGGVIKGNHTDPTGALGGGMCSSSTTLFNAALRAGLQMGARGNHRYYINRYPLGLDATVWKMGGAVQDMSFTNDTGHAILILGIKSVGSGGRGYVTYQLWGIPDGRKVSLSGPQVSNVVQATTRTEVVDTLPHGVREQTEFPSNQMDVAISRVVRDKNGRVIHSEVWRSHYILWDGIIQVGR